MKTTWRLKPFLLCHIILALLLSSLICPYLQTHFWGKVDLNLFYFFNTPLKSSGTLRFLTGILNHPLADWFEDLCILGFYLAAIYAVPKEKRLERISQFLFCVFCIALTIVLINRLFFRDLLHFRRPSPTRVIDNAIYLKDYIPWITKDNSAKSFPGDHATTTLMFACSYAYLVRGRLAIAALIYGFFLCLPRLIVGAHWFTDIFLGTGTIVYLTLTWAFCSPLADKSIQKIQKILKSFRNEKLPVRKTT